MWDNMTNEELCVEYQQTRSNDLFEYFANRNKGLIYLDLRAALSRALGDQDNIIQFGRIAMWNAMLNFDQTKKAKFSTYFYYWVLSQLREYKCEISALNLPKNIFNYEKMYRQEHPEYFNDTLSFSMEVGDSSWSDVAVLEDCLASDESIEADMEAKATREELIGYARRLSPRTAACVIEYFGLEDGVPKTLQILGDKYGVTRERIRQILVKGLTKIKSIYKIKHKEDV